LVLGWGVPGAAYGFLAGSVVASAGRWAAFAALVLRRGGEDGCPDEDGDARAPAELRRAAPGPGAGPRTAGSDPTSGAVVGVLRRFAQRPPAGGWVVEQLNEGAQASVFAVRAEDGRPAGGIGRDSLVVKVYKPAIRRPVDFVRDQFESLSRLHGK